MCVHIMYIIFHVLYHMVNQSIAKWYITYKVPKLMIITRIETKNFKPMLFGGITELTIDIESDILCVIGNNGCGKSTLLSQLHPFPAISSDYEAPGYKILHIEHNDNQYIVSSKFEGKTGKHSFIKNGVELNESFTSGVQTDLALREFNLRESIKLLLEGVVNLCDMPVTQRKNFIFGCYPSDLSFLMDHYKEISKELRAIGSNIKLMHQRQAELEGEMIPEDAYHTLQLKFDRLIETKEALLQQQAVFNQMLEQLVKDEHYDKEAPAINVDELTQMIVDYRKRMGKVKLQLPNTTVKDASTKIATLNGQHDQLSLRTNELSNEIQTLLIEIDRFEQLTREMANDHITEHELRIANYRKQLDETIVDDNLPVIDIEIIEKLDIDKLTSLIAQLPSSIVTPDMLTAMRSHMDELTSEGQTLKLELDTNNNERKYLRDQLTKIGIDNFKAGCMENCPARLSATYTYQQASDRLNFLDDAVETIIATLTKVTDDYRSLKITIESADSYQRTLWWIIQHLEPIKDQFVDLANSIYTEPAITLNRVIRLVNHAKLVNMIEVTTENLEREQITLTALKEARAEKEELLKQFGDDKHTRITAMRDQYSQLNQRCSLIAQEMGTYQQLVTLEQDFTKLEDYVNLTIATAHVNAKVNWVEEALTGITDLLHRIECELINVKSTLKAQEALRIRVEQEIVPTLHKLVVEQTKLMELEQVLSPVTGMPNAYIVKFMNNVIRFANLTIGTIWNYDFTIKELDPTKYFDFTFKVKLHNRGTIPDIKLLSKSQKEVANFAYTLAKYHVMKLGKLYPLKLDEIDSGMTVHHRTMLLTMLSDLMGSEKIKQLILVNHHSTLFSGLPTAQIAVLDPNGIVLPQTYNTSVNITR